MSFYPDILSLTNEELDCINMEPSLAYLGGGPIRSDILAKSGDGYYRLLVWIARRLEYCVIYDVGTFHGVSAVALSATHTNIVVSWDVRESLNLEQKPPNVMFHVGDVLADDGLLIADLIFLDTNHDGTFERQFVEHLRTHKYEGWLLLDDIHVDGKMESFWEWISEEKWDLTRIGHKSGTGLVRL